MKIFRNRRQRRAFMLLELLMVLAIVGVLAGMIAGGGPPGTPGAKPWPVQQTDRARDAVCVANRRASMTNVVMEQIDGGARVTSTVEGLQNMRHRLADCPAEGAYFYHEHDVLCTQHFQTMKFAEIYGL